MQQTLTITQKQHIYHLYGKNYYAISNNNVPLQLKPLNTITDQTDQHVYDIANIAMNDFISTDKKVRIGKAYIKHIYSSAYSWADTIHTSDIKFIDTHFNAMHHIEIFQYLLLHNYAVPIYPYNKTAIELGIAEIIKQENSLTI